MPRYRRRRPRTLRQVLERLGYDDEAIAEAERAGTAELLAIDGLVLPDTGRYTLAELAAKIGTEPEVVRVFWRNLGFVEPVDDERLFTRTDLRILQSLARMILNGQVDFDVTLQMARVLGQSMAQLATAIIDAAMAQADEDRERDEPATLALTSGDLLPFLSEAVDYSFRRHLRAAARRRVDLVLADDLDGQVIGFADLVRFTELSLEVTSDELVQAVEHFDDVVHRTVVAHGGRIVKMIGDAAMFTVAEPADAAVIALELVEALDGHETLAGVRVGMACGPIISRDGDLYGPVVNLASRLAGFGRRGAINVSVEMRDQLRGDRRFSVRTLGRRTLRHIGEVPVYRLRPGSLWRVAD